MDIASISAQLSTPPTAFPDCCLDISSTLTAYLAGLLPAKPAFTISVGCGSGLLEALIAYRHPNTQIIGVEVALSVNRYLPEQDIDVVGGTWDLHSRAAEATAWMFVYPREPKLVSKYLDTYGDGSVRLIVWLGPRADWADYEPCFRGSSFSVYFPDEEEVGLMGYEMLAVMRRD
ncbi:hypothetical protein BO94DRAFT_534451 [Aspergillus sclerotioniger CBS 115572]|uniref:S-adenosyl-L-methionine-dependent methyltransferase n=1 Tax=Aspergillus sclerotioniger CBS 115572 TaxID=1450535 RepID=A0A317WTH6_9EURO|nr:hypothetical protein BO94DRAFT_534451 [Aspergillus sclerotioniger CBS 115572]PWY89704.1 hypothetical protein BO94DRAFT_534451 [Aspergillus sclerotioniger CBS 115572]